MDGLDEQKAAPHDCHGCALLDRRDLLRDASLAVAAVLVALGARPAVAAAAPLEFISAKGGGREDKTYPMPAADGTQIDKDAEVIVTRWQNKVYAFSLACPHQNTAIRWYDKDHQFECPKHHSRFQPDGAYVKDSGRATRWLAGQQLNQRSEIRQCLASTCLGSADDVTAFESRRNCTFLDWGEIDKLSRR